MSTTQSLFEGVIVLFLIILIAMVLKRLGILPKEMSITFSKIVLNVSLPAIIFTSLALQKFNTDYLKMAAIMAVIELIMIGLAWFIGSLLKLKGPEKGALMMVSAFGMTSFLGYPIIRQAFPGNPYALQEAVVTSEFGVGLLLFILGPLIAMHFGSSKVEGKNVFDSLKKFLLSPIFFAIILGIIFSFFPIVHHDFAFNILFRTLKYLSHANLLLVAFTIGLIFEWKPVNSILLFVGIALVLKLIMKPLLAYWLMKTPVFTDTMREIVFIETALPSAILTAVYARQYNCRPDLVSSTIMAGLIISLGSMSLSFMLFF